MRNLYKSLVLVALTLVVGFMVSGSALAATDPFQQPRTVFGSRFAAIAPTVPKLHVPDAPVVEVAQ